MMKVKCLRCNTEYNISIDRIPAGGATATCRKCGNKIKVFPPTEGEERKDRHIQSQNVSREEIEDEDSKTPSEESIERSNDQEKEYRSKDIVRSELTEEAGIFTRFEKALAALLSVLIYTLLWATGIVIGSFTPIPIAAIVILLFIILRKKIQNRRLLWNILISVSLSLLLGNLFRVGVLPPGYEILIFFFGSLVTGTIGYKSFLKSMKKKIIKYSFLVFVVLGVPIVAINLVAFYYATPTISTESLRPTYLVGGWILESESSGFLAKQVEYKKGESFFIIMTQRTPVQTKEEARISANRALRTVKLTGNITSVESVKEGIGMVNGHVFYKYSYDVLEKEGGRTIVLWIWYCDNNETSIRAMASIVESPVENISQVEEMVTSIKCH